MTVKEKTLEEELRELHDNPMDDNVEVKTTPKIPDYTERAEPIPKLPRYARRVDPTEEAVNALLDLGYWLKSITPVKQEFVRKDGYHISYDTTLVYHFLMEVE